MSVYAEPEHPAKFSQTIMVELARLLDAETARHDRQLRVLDPFAGVGRIHQLWTLSTLPNEIAWHSIGVEIEPEWAMASGSIPASATALPFRDDSIDAVVTSPCYGNRMADTYDGSRDTCTWCAGSIIGRDETCPRCNGTGFSPSRRQTYRIALGRQLSDGSAAGLQWGKAYRELHRAAWAEAARVLRPGGLLVVNISDHVRGGVIAPVAEWHLTHLLRDVGLLLVSVQPIPTPRMRHGANHQLRVEHELVIALRTPGGTP